MNDHEIIALFFARSERAIAELDAKYGAALRALAANILPDRRDIEECSSDTYMQVWCSIPPKYPERLGAWVCALGRNICLNRYHSNTAKKRNCFYDAALDELEDSVYALATVESEFEAKELGEYINRFLSTLSKEDRYLFLRRYWFGDDVAVLAAKAGLSPHRISVRLYRVREKLQKYLKKEGLDR